MRDLDAAQHGGTGKAQEPTPMTSDGRFRHLDSGVFSANNVCNPKHKKFKD